MTPQNIYNASLSPRSKDTHANFKTFKSLKTGQVLLQNYSQIKKDDVRNAKISKFSNGGQDNLFLLEKQINV